MQKINGNAIAQYGIIIILVAIAVLGTATMLGKNILKELTFFNNSMAKNNSNIMRNKNLSVYNDNVATQSVTAGELGGTADSPVRSCDGDLCSIDYGDFVLNGIPADFQEFVKTAGNSGGTDSVLAVFDSMIEQLEDSADPADIALLKELSNYGHNISATEAKMEGAAAYLISDTTQTSDLYAQSGNISNYLTDLKDENNIGGFESKLQEIVDKYSGSTNPKDAQILALTSALSGQIMDLSDQITQNSTTFVDYADSILEGVDVTGMGGEVIGEDTGIAEKVNEITNPNSSEITNLDSAIICKTGNAEDLGSECN